MVFSNILLVFMISLQFGMYEMMIDNTLQAQTGHLQVQAPGYKDDHKMRQVVPDVEQLADELRRAWRRRRRGAGLGVRPGLERGPQLRAPDHRRRAGLRGRVSSLPGLVKEGRFLSDRWRRRSSSAACWRAISEVGSAMS